MQLNDLKSAWKQTKLMNGMHSSNAQDILALIDQPPTSRKKRLLMDLVMFILLTIICQGG